MIQVGIVGGGIAGLTCARTLHEGGIEAVVFDKARKAGGRLSTRRHDDYTFDHGAQYFTARDPAFVATVRALEARGLVAPWQGRIGAVEANGLQAAGRDTLRWVGVPTMSAVPRGLSEGLNLRTSTRITRLHGVRGEWRLQDETGEHHGPFEHVVVALPAEQARELVAPVDPKLEAWIAPAQMSPCWAAMVVAERSLRLEFDGLFINVDSPLTWAARQPSKPGRGPAEAWVLHASGAWTREHWELEADEVGTRLWEALDQAIRPATGEPMPERIFSSAHRWRYALPTSPRPERTWQSPTTGLRVAGDWCGGPRVEGAALSGHAAALALLERPG